MIPAAPPAPRWKAPYRIETARLNLCALGLQQAQDVVPRNKNHLMVAMPWAHAEPLSYEARTELLQRMRGNFDLGLDFAFGILARATGNLIVQQRAQRSSIRRARAALAKVPDAPPIPGDELPRGYKRGALKKLSKTPAFLTDRTLSARLIATLVG